VQRSLARKEWLTGWLAGPASNGGTGQRIKEDSRVLLVRAAVERVFNGLIGSPVAPLVDLA